MIPRTRTFERQAALRRLLAAVCIIGGGVMPAGAARAANFVVNSTADQVDANPGDGVCATAGGTCTLRAAIQEANALAGADAIVLPAGNYLLNRGTGDDTSVNGDFDINSDLTITGAGARTTIVDGNALDRVFDVRGGTVAISGLTVMNGDAPGSEGAGVRNTTNAVLTLSDVSIVGSSSAKGGGVMNAGTITLLRVALVGNSASNTGGGFQSESSGPFNYLTNVTISGNSAAGNGGGIECDHGEFINVTITGNTSPNNALNKRGGQPFTLLNTIVAGNASPAQCAGTITSLGYNISGDAGCDLTGPGDLPSTNPLLGPLQNNGGPTDTHALLAGSPAIDAGTNTGAPADDQRGYPRPVSGTTDIGAFEYGGFDVSGRVFEDANFAGTASAYDGGASDLGLANVDVEVYDAGTNAYIKSATTAAGGAFTLAGLANGSYKVRVRSATIGDADTPPRGGLNATVPATWPYPLAEMTWGNGVALYGGQSGNGDDAATGDNAGPGDTYVTVVVSGADVTGVDFGFAYNLIVNAADDANAGNVRSKQGSLRQFLKNANAIGAAGGTTANSSQFRMQVAANQSSGPDSWWRIAPSIALPALADAGTALAGTTQLANSGADSNTQGPEIEIYGGALNFDGLTLTSSACAVRGLTLGGFSASARAAVVITGASATGDTVAGNYVGTNYAGTASSANYHGVVIGGGATANLIGGTSAASRNLISGNSAQGVRLVGAGTANNLVRGNFIGLNAAGSGTLGNGGAGVYLDGLVGAHTVGGTVAGARNVISGNGVGIHADFTPNVTIQGNWIGLDATGTLDRGNLGEGIRARSNGLVVGGVAAGNVISGNNSYGIFLDATTGAVVEGNFIGTNAGGTAAVGNGGIGILNSGNGTRIGGSAAGAGNVISGNASDGIQVDGSSSGVIIQGDLIGVAADGVSALGNTGNGVSVFGSGNQVGGTGAGEGNQIAHNQTGVVVAGATAVNDAVLGNSIRTNAALGVDLGSDGVTANDAGDADAGPNGRLNFPVITLAVAAAGGASVNFDLDVPAGSYRIEFFRNPSGVDPSGYGEGEVLAGSTVITHPGGGARSFSAACAANPGDSITATATLCTDGVACATHGSTSEFGAAFAVQAPVIVKRAFQLDGTPIPNGAVLPRGTLFRFLLYVNNPGGVVSDVTLRDVLDPAFDYQPGSIRSDASTPSCPAGGCSAAEEAAIYAAASAGAAGSDAVNGDVVSFSGGVLDAGNQNVGNAQLDIAAGKVYGLVFTVRMR